MKTHLSILIFICLFIGKIYAQNECLYGAGKYSSEALTSNLITRMLQDNFSYIWIATDYGLNKFDGIRFIQYLHNEKDSTSLLSNNVRTLLMDNTPEKQLCIIISPPWHKTAIAYLAYLAIII